MSLYPDVPWVKGLWQEIEYTWVSFRFPFHYLFYNRLCEINHSFSVCHEWECIYFLLPKVSLSSVSSSVCWSNFYTSSLHFVESVPDFKFLAMLLIQSIKFHPRKKIFFFWALFFLELLLDNHLPTSLNYSDSYKQGFPKEFLRVCTFTTYLCNAISLYSFLLPFLRQKMFSCHIIKIRFGSTMKLTILS